MSIARFAVMGNPIDHSLSPMIHTLFAQQTGRRLVYDKILIEEVRFEQQVRDFFAEGGQGLNITLPCKERAFLMSDKATSRSALAKASNTLWMASGQLQADNTDGVGLLRDLGRFIEISNQRLLILGAGGAVRGILGPLFEANPREIKVYNRSPDRAEALKSDFPEIQLVSHKDLEQMEVSLIINATSAAFNREALMLPEALLKGRPMCYDLSYSRTGQTPFVVFAKSFECQALDGLGMLVEQAALAFEIWHGVRPNTLSVVERLRCSG